MNHDVRDRRIGRAAWVMAWVGLVVGQFHAMARHNTADGSVRPGLLDHPACGPTRHATSSARCWTGRARTRST